MSLTNTWFICFGVLFQAMSVPKAEAYGLTQGIKHPFGRSVMGVGPLERLQAASKYASCRARHNQDQQMPGLICLKH